MLARLASDFRHQAPVAERTRFLLVARSLQATGAIAAAKATSTHGGQRRRRRMAVSPPAASLLRAAANTSV